MPSIEQTLIYADSAVGAIALTAFIGQALKEWGIPSPGVTQGAVIFAGYRLAFGEFTSGAIITVSVFAGFIAGSATLFLLSRFAGPAIEQRVIKFLHLKPYKIEGLKVKLMTCNWLTLFGVRFLPMAMAPLTAVSGLVRLSTRQFYLGTGLAMLAWTVCFCAIGFIVGNMTEGFIEFIPGTWLAIILLLLLVVGALFWLIWQRKADRDTIEEP